MISSRILRIPEVMSRCGLGRTSLYAKIKTGDFPEPLKIGERASGWLENEIDSWIEKQIRRRAEKKTQSGKRNG